MRRAVFLDRDGVINAMVYDAEHGLVDSPANPNQFVLLPNIGQAVRIVHKMGWLAVVVSNQPGIAKGKLTSELLAAITRKMHTELAQEGAHLDAVYYCLHHPDAVLDEYRATCECRKPKPGLILQAAADLDVDLDQSYMIGDGVVDIQAGQAAGCRTIFVGQSKCYMCQVFEEHGGQPEHYVNNLLEAVAIICKEE
jgi:D-glycero-D-manno-heptose 1,7-bisphosphate phosphatase